MQQDFVALQWVVGEIEQTADQLGKELLAYADNLSDATRLRHALTLAHQVYATLRVVGIPSAEQLARETEESVQAMLHGRIPSSEPNLQLLLAASLQLPGYLRRIAAERREAPLDVLGAVNGLREARGETRLPPPEVQSALDLSELRQGVGEGAPAATDEEQQLLRKARQRFQVELLGILRDDAPATRLQALQKLFAMLMQRSRPGGQRYFWQACAAVCDAVVRGGVELDDRVRNALREMDNELKALIGLEQALYSRVSPEPLYRQLLEIIALSRSASANLAEIQQRHRLVPSGDKARALADLGATGAVVAVIAADLGRVLGQLETTEGDAVGISRVLREVEPDLQRMASLLAGLGYREEHEVLVPQLERISAGLTGDDLDDRLTEITAALLDVDQRLAGRAVAAGAEGAEAEARRDPLSRAMSAVCREVQAGLEQTKQAVNDYASTEGEVQVLAGCVERLHASSGALRLAGLTTAAGVLADCRGYLADVLAARRGAPLETEVDAFADALSSVEYFIERLLIDHVPAELILTRARTTLQQLVSGAPLPAKPPAEVARTPTEPAALAVPVAETAVEVAAAEELEAELPALQFEAAEEEPELELPLLEAVEPESELPAFIEGMLEAEAMAPAPLVEEFAAALAEEEEPLDPEIVEIFVEEAGEVLETIGVQFPLWRAAPVVGVPLTELRRAFHTLKGSGRMVGAGVVGELAWSIENLLNRVIERTTEASPALLEALERARLLMPGLVEAFATRGQVDMAAVDRVREGALALARGEAVSWEEAVALAPEAPVVVEPAEELEIELPALELTLEDESALEFELQVAEAEPESELPVFIEGMLGAEAMAPAPLVEEFAAALAEEAAAELVEEPATAFAEEPAAHAAEEEEPLDPEIVEIFVEEAGEVLETIGVQFPLWRAAPVVGVPLTELRRAFHTLKGSGRMVGAGVVGELAWSIENLLNRVIERTTEASPALLEAVERARLLMPGLVEAFATRGQVDDMAAVDRVREGALALARGEAVSWEEAVARAPEAPVVVEPAEELEIELPALELEPEEQPTVEVPVEVAAAEELEIELPALELEPEEQPAVEPAALKLAPEEWPAVPPEPVLEIPGLEDWQPELEPEELAAAETASADPLLQIFAREAADHLGVLRVWLVHSTAEVSDALMRCLHTLRGGAHVAGLLEFGRAIEPIDELVSSAGFAGRTLRADERALLAALADLCEELIGAGMRADAAAEQRCTALCERALRLTQPTGLPADAAPGAARISRFLEEALEKLFHASTLLDAWRAGQEVEESRRALTAELRAILEKATQLDVPTVLSLCAPLLGALQATAGREPPVGLLDTVRQALDAFLDALDRLAAGQLPEIPAAIVAALQQFATLPAPTAAPQPETAVPLVEPPDVLRTRVVRDLAQAEPELLGFFMEEAEELMAAIDEDIDAWRHDRTQHGPFEKLQRSLHTLKGGARMAGLKYLGELSHNFETFLINQSVHFGSFDDAFFARVADFHEQLLRTMDVVRDRRGLATPPAAEVPLTQPAEPVAAPEPELPAVPAPSLQAPVAAPAAPAAEGVRERIARDLQQAERELLGIFMEEAEELMASIDGGIESWRGDTAARAPFDKLQRDLHTLKGGARMAGLATLGDLAHDFETLLINQGASGAGFDAAFFVRVADAHEQLLRAMDAIKEKPQPAVAPVAVAPVVAVEERRSAAEQLGPLAEIPPPPEAVAAPRGVIARPPPAASAAAATAAAAAVKQRDEVVRVSAQLLEDLVNLAGETAISRGRVEEQVTELGQLFEDMQGTIERLQSQVRRLDIATEAQILFRRERAESTGTEGFDPLEMDRYSQLQQLSRSLVESASDLLDIKRSLAEKTRDLETVLIQQSRINSQLQEGLMRSRMVPFSSILPRIKRVVRQVAGELGKSVELELGNMAGELDRGILERVVAPLEHMLRNAVDHGVETREKRRAAGKPETGRIVIEIERDGGDVLISIADDGAGVNLAAVRAKAIERGLMTADSQLGDHEIIQFILHSGFSTATKVTQISGRGVGMDVVSSEIRQMGGSLEIQSTQGKGSLFTIRLPFTVSVSRALMVAVGADVYALPLNTVAGVVRMHVAELARYDGPSAELFRYAGQHYAVRQLAALLYPGELVEAGPLASTVPVVLVRGGGHNLAVKVDRLVGAREIVVKGLGPQFGAVPGLSGATVLGDGSVVVILDIPAMLRADSVRGALAVEADAQAAKAAQAKRAPLIMVVDDSVTVRKVTTRFLEREGMRVVTAKDGADAMVKLQEQVPDLMLLDIEMPHMDGFEVVSKVRLSETLQHLPIIMITSRTGDKHRERALSLGANMYLGKPYQESVLLEHIDMLLKRAGV